MARKFFLKTAAGFDIVQLSASMDNPVSREGLPRQHQSHSRARQIHHYQEGSMPVIKCKTCGSERLTRRRNTKYCEFHRIHQDRMYAMRNGAKPATCSFCKGKFIPVPATSKVCANCYEPPDTNGHGPCGLCKDDRNYVHAAVKVCGPCFEAPKNESRINQAMLKKHKELMEHPTTIPPLEV